MPRQEPVLSLRSERHLPVGGRCKYLRPPSIGAAPRGSAAPSIAVAARDTNYSDKRWILDTGTSVHRFGKSVEGERVYLEHQVTLETANGHNTVSDGVRMDIEGVAQAIVCAKMPCDAQALSIGRLCAEDGFSMSWKPFEVRPEFLGPSGKPLDVVVENFVPLLSGGEGRGGGGGHLCMHRGRSDANTYGHHLGSASSG